MLEHLKCLKKKKGKKPINAAPLQLVMLEAYRVQSKKYLLFPARTLLDSSQGLQDLHRAADARLTQNLTTPSQTESSGCDAGTRSFSISSDTRRTRCDGTEQQRGGRTPTARAGDWKVGRCSQYRRTIQLH